MSIIAQKEEIKKSKKKIQKNIDDYLQQREHIRQFKLDKSASPEGHKHKKSHHKKTKKPGFVTTNF